VELYAIWTAIGVKTSVGGWVIYEKPNAAATEWKYMEAARVITSSTYQWGPMNDLVDLTSKAVGDGSSNTTDFVINFPSGAYAANYAVNTTYLGQDDWFLPSFDELVRFRNLGTGSSTGTTATKLSANKTYWTSSEYDEDWAWYVYSTDTSMDTASYYNKNVARSVALARTF